MKVAIAAAAVVVVAVVGFNLVPRTRRYRRTRPEPDRDPGTDADPDRDDSNIVAIARGALTMFPDGPLPAGTYTVAPFVTGDGMCHVPPQSGCTETTADDAILVTITIPEDGQESYPVWLGENKPPGGAALGVRPRRVAAEQSM